MGAPARPGAMVRRGVRRAFEPHFAGVPAARPRRDRGSETTARRRFEAVSPGFLRRLLWRTSGPPVRFRVKTTAAFVPSGNEPAGLLIPAFDELQTRQVECVKDCVGLAIDRVKVVSPFDARVK